MQAYTMMAVGAHVLHAIIVTVSHTMTCTWTLDRIG